MRRKKLQHTALAAAIAVVFVVPLGAYVFVKSGVYDVAAFSPHSDFTEWLTHETMIHSVKRHARTVVVPDRVTPRQVVAGFCAYEAHCVACHGAAGVARQPWTYGFEPGPPYLLDHTRRFTPRELFWIVQNGIKMTAMPAWRQSLSDEQSWDIVAWLEASAKLPSQTYVQWRQERRCGGGLSLPSPSRGSSATRPRGPAPPTGATGG